jgi:hypothetical protein
VLCFDDGAALAAAHCRGLPLDGQAAFWQVGTVDATP